MNYKADLCVELDLELLRLQGLRIYSGDSHFLDTDDQHIETKRSMRWQVVIESFQNYQ
jgi:hypothetical protein